MTEKTIKKTFRLTDNDINSIELIKENYGLSSDTAAIEYALNLCAKNIKDENGIGALILDKVKTLENDIIKIKSSSRQSEDYGYIIASVLNTVFREDLSLNIYGITPSPIIKQAEKYLEAEKKRNKQINTFNRLSEEK